MCIRDSASLVARRAAGEDPVPGGGPDSQAAKDRAAKAASRDSTGSAQEPTA